MTSQDILKPITPLNGEPGTELFETERLVIRRLALSDAVDMSTAGNDPLVCATLSNRFPYPYTLAAAESFLRTACEQDGTAYPYHNAILLKPNTPGNPSDKPVFVGAIGIKLQGDVLYRTWQIGYWLASAQWGKGYMTEATSGFARWLFATWPVLNRLEGEAYSANLASQNVLRKSGFVEESRRKDAVEKNGVTMDLIMFRLLRSEYEKAQEVS